MKFITDEILEELSKIGYDLKFDYDKAMTLYNYEKDYKMNLRLIEEGDDFPDSELFAVDYVANMPFIGLYIDITQDGYTIDEYRLNAALIELSACELDISDAEEELEFLQEKLKKRVLENMDEPSFINDAIEDLQRMKSIKDQISGLNYKLKYLKCFESFEMC